MPHPLGNSLLLSDLHLTSNQRDEYRWKIFDWVRTLKGVQRLWILGDLTDAKDYHPAALVNRLVDELSELAQRMEVFILRGNHDGIDPEWPYFRFLNAITNVAFFSEPAEVEKGLLVLPHSRNWEQDWAELSLDYKVILLHATVSGSESESGMELSGVPTSFFAETSAMVLAGDVHVPQKVGKVEYVGAPYPIRFGDSFSPRALHFDSTGKRTVLHPPHIQRLALSFDSATEVKMPEVYEGDQCKIRVALTKAEALEWAGIKKRIRDLCKEAGVDLVALELERKPEGKAVVLNRAKVGADPQSAFSRYCAQKRIAKGMQDQGANLLSKALANAVKTP